jgi:nitrate/nitrite-specific signal transduction histidine kinase
MSGNGSKNGGSAPPAGAAGANPDRLAALEGECVRLRAALDQARGELARLEAEQAGVEGRLQDVERETERINDLCVRLERRTATLAQLNVACRRLHGTVDRQELLAALQDIVCNLIGSEQVAIFETGPEPRRLELTAGLGVDRERWSSVAFDDGPIGRSAASGAASFADEPGESGVTACVPLAIDGRVTGVIAVFALLPQKQGLERADRELLQTVAAQAATALYCARLHERAGGWTGA